MMVSKLGISFSRGLFSGAMLVSGRVGYMIIGGSTSPLSTKNRTLALRIQCIRDLSGDQMSTFNTYCWWKKSCITWDVKTLVNNGINYKPQLVIAGFLNHQQYWCVCVFLVDSNIFEWDVLSHFLDILDFLCKTFWCSSIWAPSLLDYVNVQKIWMSIFALEFWKFQSIVPMVCIKKWKIPFLIVWVILGILLSHCMR